MKKSTVSLLGLIAAFALSSAVAQTPRPTPGLAQPPALEVSSFVLMELSTGAVLASRQPDLRVEPASITKIMSAYVAFESLRTGETSLSDETVVSENAWRMQGSRTFLDLNSKVSVENLLLGMIVQSGNDASVALAEHLAGAEEDFAGIMNATAARLGLTGTRYENSTGWPDENHYTTAADTALLTRAMIRDHPELYAMHAIREFTWNGIAQPNRNTLAGAGCHGRWRQDRAHAIGGILPGCLGGARRHALDCRGDGRFQRCPAVAGCAAIAELRFSLLREPHAA